MRVHGNSHIAASAEATKLSMCELHWEKGCFDFCLKLLGANCLNFSPAKWDQLIHLFPVTRHAEVHPYWFNLRRIRGIALPALCSLRHCPSSPDHWSSACCDSRSSTAHFPRNWAEGWSGLWAGFPNKGLLFHPNAQDKSSGECSENIQQPFATPRFLPRRTASNSIKLTQSLDTNNSEAQRLSKIEVPPFILMRYPSWQKFPH